MITKTEQSLVKFLRETFPSKWLEPFLESLEGLSEEKFHEKLLKYSSEEKFFKVKILLDRLNYSEAILLILKETILNRIKKTQVEIEISLEQKPFLFDGTCVLGSPKSKARSKINLDRERIRIDQRSLRKVGEELDRRVRKRLGKSIASLSKDKNKVEGSDTLYFYEGDVYWVN